MGFIDFNSGDVLTADQMDLVMRQSVMVFDDASARTTALTGVIAEGMITYLKDTNQVEQCTDGSTFVPVSPATLNATAIVRTVVTDSTTARTISPSDQGKIIRFTSGSAITVTIDGTTDFTSGQSVDIIQDGAGVITVTADTATVAGDAVSTTSGSFTIGDQFSAASLLGLGSDTYRLIGNITAVV